jgi:hypothetical protein
MPPGTDKQCARRWVMHYIKFGETPEESKAWQRMRQSGVRRRLWTDADTRKLKHIVDLEPGLYLDELVDRMETVTGKRWHYSVIWDKLRNQVGYSLQVVSDKAAEMDVEERESYMEAVKAAVIRPEMLVYIDETHKDRSSSRRRRWWSRRGRTPVRTSRFDLDVRMRYTLLAACDINGFINEACDLVRRGSTQQEQANPFIGTIDTERLEMWIEERLCPVLGDYSLGEARSIVILDNATIHHSERVRELITATGATTIYTAPYSPDLNSIEQMFDHYKKSLKKDERIDWLTAHFRLLTL